jgi:hypothetical protein
MLASAPAFAQATRTWVSGVGDDANPCSRTAPCKTFAGAISKTAAGGEIDALDPGGFGALTITKAITIDGGGQVASVLVAGTNGLVVAAGASDVVTLRNLQIQGLAPNASAGLNGVRLTSRAALIMDHMQINNFANYCIAFEPNAANSALVVTNSTVSNCAQGGIFVAPQGVANVHASVSRTTSTRNNYGIAVSDGAAAFVTDSTMSANSTYGVLAYSASSPSGIVVKHSDVSGNGQYGIATSGANATVAASQTTVFSNGTGMKAFGGNIYSYGDNEVNGNTTTDGAPTATLPMK